MSDTKLQMQKYLAQKTYDIHMAATESNDEMLKQMAGNVGEHLIAEMVGGQVVAKDGYDVVALHETKLSNGLIILPGDLVEVKCCVIQTNGQCKAYNLGGKEDHCDYIALVDMTSHDPENIRISIIPTDVFFEEARLTMVKGVPERISWNGTYVNKQENSNRSVNTNLFLQYEVV